MQSFSEKNEDNKKHIQTKKPLINNCWLFVDVVIVLIIILIYHINPLGKSLINIILEFVQKNWALLAAAFALVGMQIYRISPFEKSKELNYKKKMAERHIELGNQFLNVSQLVAAKNEFEEALKIQPGNKEAHLGKLKAEIFEPIKNREEDEGYDPEISEKRLRLLLEQNPNDPHCLTFLGYLYESTNKQRALSYYDEAISKDKAMASAYYGKGMILDQSGYKKEAIENFKQAITLSGMNQTFLNNLAYLYFQEKDFKHAKELYEYVLNLNGAYLLTYYNLSNTYRLTGELENALYWQEILISKFDDIRILKYKFNDSLWFFHINKNQSVYFINNSMKKCYAYYNASLTAYLLRKMVKAESLINKAKDIKDKDEDQVKELVRYDIGQINETQKSYSELLSDFMKSYL
jgi:tetratricopeptide (TPR) repeat protein